MTILVRKGVTCVTKEPWPVGGGAGVMEVGREDTEGYGMGGDDFRSCEAVKSAGPSLGRVCSCGGGGVGVERRSWDRRLMGDEGF